MRQTTLLRLISREPDPGPEIERPEDLADLTGNSEITVEVGDNYFSPRNFVVDRARGSCS